MIDNGGNRFAAEVERVRTELAAWRGDSERGRKIPLSVWAQTTALAQKYGVQAVSKALRLNYGNLKQQVRGGARRLRVAPRPPPAFIELKAETTHAELACVIELAKGNGTHLRICLPSASAVDWGRIKEAFLGA